MVDDANIFIGDNVMFAPNVNIATAGHPIDIELRRQGYQFNKEIHIGNNVWIGAGAIILPGVTINIKHIIICSIIKSKLSLCAYNSIYIFLFNKMFLILFAERQHVSVIIKYVRNIVEH